MKKIFCHLLIIIAFTGCSIDNYEGPSITVTGKILDAESGEMVASGGSNGGTLVRFYENGSTQPLIYQTKADGSFVNKAVFPGNYTYTAIGPFRAVDTELKPLVITGNTEIEIPVLPYLHLKATVLAVNGTSVDVKVEYQKTNAEDVFTGLGIAYSTYPAPNAFSSSGGGVILDDVSSQDLTSGEKTYTISNLSAGRKYYFRAVGNVTNPGNYYNYSVQQETDIP